jgi:hypothetical protein
MTNGESIAPLKQAYKLTADFPETSSLSLFDQRFTADSL